MWRSSASTRSISSFSRLKRTGQEGSLRESHGMDCPARILLSHCGFTPLSPPLPSPSAGLCHPHQRECRGNTRRPSLDLNKGNFSSLLVPLRRVRPLRSLNPHSCATIIASRRMDFPSTAAPADLSFSIAPSPGGAALIVYLYFVSRQIGGANV